MKKIHSLALALAVGGLGCAGESTEESVSGTETGSLGEELTQGGQGGRIRVLSATYGGNQHVGVGNVTNWVARDCNNQTRCDFYISVSQLGDPAVGRPKDFSVDYTCGTGQSARHAYAPAEANGRYVSLSCDGGSQPPPPPPPPGCGVLYPGQAIYPNQGLRSCDGRTSFFHASNGNVVLYHDNRQIVASNVYDSSTQVLTLQGDGNLVQYNRSGRAVWASNTPGHDGAELVVQDDCNVVLYDRSGRPYWHTNTAGCYLH